MQSNLQNAVNLELYCCLYLFYFVSSPLGGSLGKEIYVSDFGVFQFDGFMSCKMNFLERVFNG
jgi:hypothetical protein